MRAIALALLIATNLTWAATDQTCPGEKWEKIEPNSAGWNVEKLNEARQMLSTMDTSALVVVHKGKVVMDYGRPSSSILLHSARKSIMSMLFGIAHAQGKIDLAASLKDLSIDDRSPLTEVEKSATIKDLLSARSCVYIEAAAETKEMKAARPPRGSCKPGESWYYNNWDFNALGTIYKQLTGNDVYEGLKLELAQPLQFENFTKMLDTKYQYEFSSVHPAYHIYLSANDLARVGLLMSRKGDWCGKQIVPESWVSESTAPISKTKNQGIAYGYMWWIGENGIHFGNRFKGPVFSARGHLGQILVVAQTEDLVIAHLVDSNTESKQLKGGEFNKVLKMILSAMP